MQMEAINAIMDPWGLNAGWRQLYFYNPSNKYTYDGVFAEKIERFIVGFQSTTGAVHNQANIFYGPGQPKDNVFVGTEEGRAHKMKDAHGKVPNASMLTIQQPR